MKKTIATWAAWGAALLVVGGAITLVGGFIIDIMVSLYAVAKAIGIVRAATAATTVMLKGLGLEAEGAANAAYFLSAGLGAIAVVAGGIAIGGLLYYVLSGRVKTGLDNWNASLKNLQPNMHSFNRDVTLIANQKQKLDTLHKAMQQNSADIASYTNALKTLKPGSANYLATQRLLNESDKKRTFIIKEEARAQKDLANAQSDFVKRAGQLRMNITNITDMKSVLSLAKQIASTSPLGLGFGGKAFPGNTLTKGLDDARLKFHLIFDYDIPKFQEGLNKLNMDPFNKSVADTTITILNLIKMMSGANIGATLFHLTRQLGHIPTPEEFAPVHRVNQLVRVATTPGTQLYQTGGASAARNVRQSVNDIINILHKVPSQSTVSFLVKNASAIKAITHYILLNHKVPDKLVTSMFLQNAAKVTKQLHDVQTAYSNIRREQHGHQDLQIDSGQANQALTKLGLLDKATAKRRTATVFVKTNPANLSQWGTQKGADVALGIAHGVKSKSPVFDGSLRSMLTSGQSKSTANAGGATLGNSVASGVVTSVESPANIARAQQSVATLLNNMIAHAHHVTLQAHSPSKVAKHLLGDPIIEGIIAGIMSKQTKLKDTLDSVLNTVLGIYSNYKSQFQTALGTLFAGPSRQGPFGNALQMQLGFSPNGPVTFGAVRQDLAQQVAQFKRFNRSLGILRRRGAPLALIQQIAAIGPGAQPEINALLEATRTQEHEYFRLFNQGQTAISSASRQQTLMQLNAWKKMGSNVALGFLNGLQDYAPRLDRWVRQFFLGLYWHVKMLHKSHSPSRLYYDEGVNVMKGFQLGLNDGGRGIRWPGSPNVAMAGGSGQSVCVEVHQTIYANADESLDTTLRRAKRLYESKLPRLK